MPTDVNNRSRLTPNEPCSAPAPAACISREAIALCGARRYIPHIHFNRGPAPQIREAMRAEIERLVEEIKQSVGLLRRHL
jgi:hypothetical protein